jgi:hypothetical protein
VGPPPWALLFLWGRVVCMRDIFILNETWAQHKAYILVGTLLGWHTLHIT